MHQGRPIWPKSNFETSKFTSLHLFHCIIFTVHCTFLFNTYFYIFIFTFLMICPTGWMKRNKWVDHEEQWSKCRLLQKAKKILVWLFAPPLSPNTCLSSLDKPARLIIRFVIWICSDSVFVRLKENIIKYWDGMLSKDGRFEVFYFLFWIVVKLFPSIEEINHCVQLNCDCVFIVPNFVPRLKRQKIQFGPKLTLSLEVNEIQTAMVNTIPIPLVQQCPQSCNFLEIISGDYHW